MRNLLPILLLAGCYCPTDVVALGSSRGPTDGDSFKVRVVVSDRVMEEAQLEGPVSAVVRLAAVDMVDGQELQLNQCDGTPLAVGTVEDTHTGATVGGPIEGCARNQGCQREFCVAFPDDGAERIWNVSVELFAESCLSTQAPVRVEFEVLD